jgi:dTDP-4-dehydrorhamnose reductase
VEKRAQARVLVTGAAGMLGSQLLLSVPDGIAVVGTDLREAPGVDAVGLDLAEPVAVARLFDEHGPFTGVLHTAAFTAVDAAEEREDEARRVNETASHVLAEACARAGVPLVVVSTDFVFDGEGQRPYREDDAPRPLSAYGRTKLAGEKAALAAHPDGTRVVRTQWLYCPRGKHFPGTMLALAKERDTLRVVDDQVGSPTSTLELAPALWDVLLEGEPGIYHAACDGECSWYDLASATLESAGVEGVSVEPCTTAEFPRPAHRPAYSVLDCSRLTALRGRTMAGWREALMTYLGTEST